MNLEVFKNDTKEVWIEHAGVTATVTQWANCEGCNLMVANAKDLSVRMCGSFRWDEIDAILLALTAAKA